MVKTTAETNEGLKNIMGKKNIVTTYFSNTKNDMHSGKVNVECLNPVVYEQFLKKILKLHSKYVKFNPHPHSLDGSNAQDEETLKKYGFLDVNTTLAGAVVALKNALGTGTSRNEVTREKINTLVTKAVTKGNQQLKKELTVDMKEMKETIIGETHTYTDTMTHELKLRIDEKFENMMNVMANTRKMLTEPRSHPSLPSTSQGKSN